MTDLDFLPFIDSEGRRYHAPYFCLCCQKAVSPEQFAESTFCAYCELRRCHSGPMHIEQAHGFTYFTDVVEEGHGQERELARKRGSELTRSPLA
jgi:hypothetical protein